MTQHTETKRRILSSFFLLLVTLVALDRGSRWFTVYIVTVQILGSVELILLLWPPKTRPFLLPALGLWLGTMASFLYLYRPSLETVSWTIMLGPAYDTSAYVVGRLWGRHKVPISISASKTYEGCAGGVFFGTCLSLLYYWRLHSLTHGGWSIEHPVMIALIASLVTMSADLATSWLKRHAQSKDTGFLALVRATGHGGFVDRYFAPACAATVLAIYVFLGH